MQIGAEQGSGKWLNRAILDTSHNVDFANLAIVNGGKVAARSMRLRAHHSLLEFAACGVANVNPFH